MKDFMSCALKSLYLLNAFIVVKAQLNQVCGGGGFLWGSWAASKATPSLAPAACGTVPYSTTQCSDGVVSWSMSMTQHMPDTQLRTASRAQRFAFEARRGAESSTLCSSSPHYATPVPLESCCCSLPGLYNYKQSIGKKMTIKITAGTPNTKVWWILEASGWQRSTRQRPAPARTRSKSSFQRCCAAQALQLHFSKSSWCREHTWANQDLSATCAICISGARGRAHHHLRAPPSQRCRASRTVVVEGGLGSGKVVVGWGGWPALRENAPAAATAHCCCTGGCSIPARHRSIHQGH